MTKKQLIDAIKDMPDDAKVHITISDGKGKDCVVLSDKAKSVDNKTSEIYIRNFI